MKDQIKGKQQKKKKTERTKEKKANFAWYLPLMWKMWSSFNVLLVYRCATDWKKIIISIRIYKNNALNIDVILCEFFKKTIPNKCCSKLNIWCLYTNDFGDDVKGLITYLWNNYKVIRLQQPTSAQKISRKHNYTCSYTLKLWAMRLADSCAFSDGAKQCTFNFCLSIDRAVVQANALSASLELEYLVC